MSSDVSTSSSSPLTPPRFLADDQALRRAFDAEYAAAVDSARSQLGDAVHLAPRVVETAIVNVWQQRATLTNHEQFKKVLADEVHHGAARALSRRAAAARFNSGRDDRSMTGTHAATGDADAERSWAQIIRTIHGEGDTARAHREVASTSRHDAAAHLKTVGKGRNWTIPALIGVIALAASVAGVMYIDKLGEDDAMYALVSAPNMQPIAQSGPGQLGATTLGDGTKMRMGADSKVFLADNFATKVRVLRVEGTASFDVAHDPKLPFRIIANRTQVIATGTSVAVSTFLKDYSTSVAVLVKEGSVVVKSGKKSETVAANQPVVADSTGIRPATADESAEAFDWLDNKVTAKGNLRWVVDQLNRWYNADVKVPDLTLLELPASFSAPLDSLPVALAQIAKSANIKSAYEGASQVFEKATVPASAPAKAAAKPARSAKKKK